MFRKILKRRISTIEGLMQSIDRYRTELHVAVTACIGEYNDVAELVIEDLTSGKLSGFYTRNSIVDYLAIVDENLGTKYSNVNISNSYNAIKMALLVDDIIKENFRRNDMKKKQDYARSLNKGPIADMYRNRYMEHDYADFIVTNAWIVNQLGMYEMATHKERAVEFMKRAVPSTRDYVFLENAKDISEDSVISESLKAVEALDVKIMGKEYRYDLVMHKDFFEKVRKTSSPINKAIRLITRSVAEKNKLAVILAEEMSKRSTKVGLYEDVVNMPFEMSKLADELRNYKSIG